MVLFQNVDIINDFLGSPFPAQEASVALSTASSNLTKNQITVIFVDPYMIRKLNREFRKKDEETDVLSFEPSFNEVELEIANRVGLPMGEVYVCPKYIVNALDDRYGAYREERLLEEVYRMIIHGILHISGRTHSTALEYDQMVEDIEPMYKEQEEILAQVTKMLQESEKVN